MDQRPEQSSETIKLLEENKREHLCGIIFGNDFLGMTPKAQATKGKVDKLEFIKMKNFCTSKNTINRMKSSHRREKIFEKSYI